MSDLRWFGPGPTWRCRIGRHSWTEFGDCRDCRKGQGDLVRILTGQPDRISERRQAARKEAGAELQRRLRASGLDPTLELCIDAAVNGWADQLLDYAASR